MKLSEKLSVNELVVFSHRPDAALFRIKVIEGIRIGVIDRSIEDHNPAMQWVDKSMLFRPSLGQLAAVV